VIWEIINDAAQAYQGVIPEDRWHEPYMPPAELKEQMERGVVFWGMELDGKLAGVMGILLCSPACARASSAPRNLAPVVTTSLRPLSLRC
jgi:hypothetical protein